MRSQNVHGHHCGPEVRAEDSLDDGSTENRDEIVTNPLEGFHTLRVGMPLEYRVQDRLSRLESGDLL